MTKELQDLAWSCLPKEFRKEVKRVWSIECDCAIKYKSELHKHRTALLYELFGDNLTSDAEGEEMLTVSRKKVQEEYRESRGKAHPYNINSYNRGFHVGCATMLKELFGSKCLPDDAKVDAKDTKPSNVDSLEQKTTDLNTDRPTCTDVCSSQIDERRLNIAATIAAGMVVDWYHEPQGGSMNAKCRRLAEVSIIITDALIAECMTPTNNN